MDNQQEKQPLPQLVMRLSTLEHLPEIELKDGFSLHTEQPGSDACWEWIESAAFGQPLKYDAMRAEAAYAPERVWFVREHSQDVASASAFRRDQYPGEGYLHMVATHPWCTGQGSGRLAVLAALHQFRREGLSSAVLTTDDHRLSAIRIYKSLGFEPVMSHESHPERWRTIEEKLAQGAPKRPAPIPLWTGEVPYYRAEYGQPKPSVTPFEVQGSWGAVVVCPGGGYTMKASHEGHHIARMLNSCGISAYVLDYRVMPYTVPVPLEDAQRAIRLVRSFGYEKVGILGFSAGGHLTCSAATLYDLGNPQAEDPIERLSCRPDAFVPCYAVVSFASFRHQGSLKALLKEEAENYRLIRAYSAELHVDGDTPPAFIWHTASDPVVPVENSLMLASALAHAMVPFEVHIFPEGEHGLGLAGGNPVVGQWPQLLQKWLLNQGFGV